MVIKKEQKCTIGTSENNEQSLPVTSQNKSIVTNQPNFIENLEPLHHSRQNSSSSDSEKRINSLDICHSSELKTRKHIIVTPEKKHPEESNLELPVHISIPKLSSDEFSLFDEQKDSRGLDSTRSLMKKHYRTTSWQKLGKIDTEEINSIFAHPCLSEMKKDRHDGKKNFHRRQFSDCSQWSIPSIRLAEQISDSVSYTFSFDESYEETIASKKTNTLEQLYSNKNKFTETADEDEDGGHFAKKQKVHPFEWLQRIRLSSDGSLIEA